MQAEMLILFESDDLPSLPVDQMLALQGPRCGTWLTSHNADGESGTSTSIRSLATSSGRMREPASRLAALDLITGGTSKGANGATAEVCG